MKKKKKGIDKEMKHDCAFTLSSPGGLCDDAAFTCFAQATEGDFTYGRKKLNQIAEVLAYNWVFMRINPNDPVVYRSVCNQFGVQYDNLLNEEVDYLVARVEDEIKRYGASG